MATDAILPWNPKPSRFFPILFLAVACAAVLFFAYYIVFRWPCETIEGLDIRVAQTVVLKSDREPVALSIQIEGEIDGSATIVSPWGNAWRIGPGKFILFREDEFYSRPARIQYTPDKVNSGRITVRYRFMRPFGS